MSVYVNFENKITTSKYSNPIVQGSTQCT